MGWDEAEREVRNRRHDSARAAAINASLVLVIGLFLWVLNHFISLPRWLVLVVMGLTASSFVAECFVYMRHTRRLKALRESRDSGDV